MSVLVLFPTSNEKLLYAINFDKLCLTSSGVETPITKWGGCKRMCA